MQHELVFAIKTIEVVTGSQQLCMQRSFGKINEQFVPKSIIRFLREIPRCTLAAYAEEYNGLSSCVQANLICSL